MLNTKGFNYFLNIVLVKKVHDTNLAKGLSDKNGTGTDSRDIKTISFFVNIIKERTLFQIKMNIFVSGGQS